MRELDIRLRIRLDADGASRELGEPVGVGAAFFILGLVQAQLARAFGPRHCRVELEGATGVPPWLAAAMRGFAPALQQAVTDLACRGEAWVQEPAVVEVLALVWPVASEPEGDGWRVRRCAH